jgi:hypothetical protein
MEGNWQFVFQGQTASGRIARGIVHKDAPSSSVTVTAVDRTLRTLFPLDGYDSPSDATNIRGTSTAQRSVAWV